jgi:histone H3/H4
MTDLIVKSGVKELLADNAVSSDFYDEFNEEVAKLIEEAAERAEANDRKTVQPRDL